MSESLERKRIREGYETAIQRIKRWILGSAVFAVLGFAAWKLLVPRVPEWLHLWFLAVAVTTAMLSFGWFLVSWILLAVYSWEKKSRLDEL